MPRSALVLPALATAAALATGLVAGPAVAATPHGRSAVHFTTTKSHHVIAPSSTRPGVARLRYTAKSGDDPYAGLILVEAKHPDRSNAAQVASDLNRRSPAKLLEDYRLTALVKRDSGMYVQLTRGTYYVADAASDKFTKSDISSMRVSGARVDARVPASQPAEVTSRRTLSLPRTLPKSGWLHLRNNTSSIADLGLLPVKAAATDAQLHALVVHPSEKKLNAVVDEKAFSFDLALLSIFGPHSATWVQYHGPAGRYVALFQAATGNENPHLKAGQVRVVTLK